MIVIVYKGSVLVIKSFFISVLVCEQGYVFSENVA